MTTEQQLAREIDRRGGNGHGRLIVAQARAHRLPVSLACALVEHESGFRNVFGADPVRNPVRSRSNSHPLAVSRARYLAYRAFRRQGLGMQGVGLTQLTWWEFQDHADRLGGCWRPEAQLRVAFRDLKDLTAAHGLHDGLKAYNGAGAAAEQYAWTVARIARRWHVELTP